MHELKEKSIDKVNQYKKEINDLKENIKIKLVKQHTNNYGTCMFSVGNGISQATGLASVSLGFPYVMRDLVRLHYHVGPSTT